MAVPVQDTSSILKTSDASDLVPNFLLLLDKLIMENAKEWGTKRARGELEAQILAPVKKQIQSNVSDEVARNDYLGILHTLSFNPYHLRDFVERVVTRSYLEDTFKAMSLSDVKTDDTFKRLGIQVLAWYPINDILEVSKSDSFKELHMYRYPINDEHIRDLNGKLKKKRRRYHGPSERVARVMIDTYFDTLADRHPTTSRLEFWLARITADHKAVEIERTDGAKVHRTYLTGEVDYALLTIVGCGDTENSGLPQCQLDEETREDVLDTLGLGEFQGTYQNLARYLERKLSLMSPSESLDWEILFVEAKRREWFSLRGISSGVFQAIATCCAAQRYGRKGRRVLKFSLTSGDHWVFGVVNLITAKAYATQVLDNSDLKSTEKVLLLKSFWMVLPGQMIEDHLFGKVEITLKEPKVKTSEASTGKPQGPETEEKAA